MNLTPLNESHVQRGARMVDFHGWNMPLLFTNIIEEHRSVRTRAGVFDVSHITRLRVTGADSGTVLEKVLTRSIKGLEAGRVRYSLLCNGSAGIIDDLLVYASDDYFLLVGNAPNRDAVVTHLEEQSEGLDVVLEDLTFDSAMVALQGPQAVTILTAISSPRLARLRRFAFGSATVNGERALVSRTGYTGEDGFELILGPGQVGGVWEKLIELGATPAGLGARDTLRIEAAFPLYGHEIGLHTNPLEAGLGWAVDLEGRNCVGAARLRFVAAEGPIRKIVGLELENKKIARENMPVLKDLRKIGEVTSGTFSPTLEKSVALARLESQFAVAGRELAIDVRGTKIPATVVPIPFYRRPK